MTAKSVIDVILGEAKAGDYDDMLAIASVIENRARQTGKRPDEVVSLRSQFNAYGKPLPKGVDKYRKQALEAFTTVRAKGPVHNATFYATPSATKNLPSGLNKVTQTKGHVYFDDPQKRGIATADLGLSRPIKSGLGLENLVADAPSTGKIGTVTPETRAVYDQLTGYFGPIGVKSGYRGPEHNRNVGGARNSQHTRGKAIDLDTKNLDATTRQQLLAAAYDNPKIGGIGLYPSGAIHLDTRPRSGATGVAMWGGNGSFSKNPSELNDIAAMTSADRFGLYGAKTLPVGGVDPTPRPNQMPQRPISKTPQYNQAVAFDQGGILDPRVGGFVSQAQAAPQMPTKRAVEMPRRPVTPTPQPILRGMPQRPNTATPTKRPTSQAITPSSVANQYAQYGAGRGVPVVPPQLNTAAQYAAYQSPQQQQAQPLQTPTMAAPRYIAPSPTIATAPVKPPQRPVTPTPAQTPTWGDWMKGAAGAIAGSVAGSAVAGPFGGMAGAELGRALFTGKAPLENILGKGSDLTGVLSGLLGGGRPFDGEKSYVNARDFNNALGFGGTSNASDYVRSGSAPAGQSYRDSAGGSSTSYGNGYSERTNRFGVTSITTPDGKTARKI
jgi:hypothetical protein